MPSKVFKSRLLDKFIIRMPEGMRQRMEALASQNRKTMNAEFIRAIENHLENQLRQRLLLDSLEIVNQAAGVEHPATEPQVDKLP